MVNKLTNESLTTIYFLAKMIPDAEKQNEQIGRVVELIKKKHELKIEHLNDRAKNKEYFT